MKYCEQRGCTFAAIAGGLCDRHATLEAIRREELIKAATARRERDPEKPARKAGAPNPEFSVEQERISWRRHCATHIANAIGVR